MTTADRGLINRWFEEVWNKRRQAAIYEMLDPTAVVHGLPGEEIRGPDGFLPFWQKFTSAFPDIRVSVDAVVAEGDMAVARCTVQGKHSGKGLGVEPTGREISFTGMAMARMQDGKIIEAWNNFDFLTFNQQLGL